MNNECFVGRSLFLFFKMNLVIIQWHRINGITNIGYYRSEFTLAAASVNVYAIIALNISNWLQFKTITNFTLAESKEIFIELYNLKRKKKLKTMKTHRFQVTLIHLLTNILNKCFVRMFEQILNSWQWICCVAVNIWQKFVQLFLPAGSTCSLILWNFCGNTQSFLVCLLFDISAVERN